MNSTNYRSLKLVTLALMLTMFASQLFAQSSNNGIFFQAVARDNFSNPAKERKIYVQTSIIQSTTNGTSLLIEQFQVNTDGTGMFSISIGNGTRVGGTATGLNAIDWSQGPFYLNLKIAITPLAGNVGWDYTKEWVNIGTTSFGAVPYALYSANAGGVNQKLSITDTTKMLAPYAKAASVLDSAYIKSQLKSKIAIADSGVSYITPTSLTSAINTTVNAGNLNGTILNSSVTESSLTSVGTLANLTVTNPIVGSVTGNAATATIAGNITATSNTTLTTLSNLTGVGTLANLTVTNPIVGSVTGNAATATIAGNITATSNTTLTTLSNLTSVGTITSLTTGSITNSGKVIVGATSPASESAVLEASSTSQGFLPPRMTYAQRNLISNPANGLIIFCSDCGLYGEPQYYDGNNNWRKFDLSLGSGTGTLNLVIDALFSTSNGTSGQLRGQSFTTTSNPGRLIKIVTNAIGGVSGTQLTNGIAQSYLRIRSYVNDNELTNPNALSGEILATSKTNPTILNYDYGQYYPTVEFTFPNSIVLLPNTKYVIQFVIGNGVAAYVKIAGPYSGGQAYDINGINQGYVRDFPFQLYLQQF